MRRMDVLVVDDDRGSCLLMQKMLLSLGFSCDIANNFGEGMKAVYSKPYSFILMDCLLPDQNGWVASRVIKSLPIQCGDPPTIIGILSCENEQLRSRCETAGMERILVKPVHKKELRECLSGIICNTTSSLATTLNLDSCNLNFEIESRKGSIFSDQVTATTDGACENFAQCQENSALSTEEKPRDTASSLNLVWKLKEAEPLSIGELNTNCIIVSPNLQI